MAGRSALAAASPGSAVFRLADHDESGVLENVSSAGTKAGVVIDDQDGPRHAGIVSAAPATNSTANRTRSRGRSERRDAWAPHRNACA